MDNELVLRINVSPMLENCKPEDVYRFLENNIPAAEGYEMTPAKPGGLRAAAFDFMLLLQVTSSFASIASLIWVAYDKFVASKKKTQKDSQDMYIDIPLENGETEYFSIGDEYKEEEVFVKDFASKVTQIIQEGNVSKTTISEIKHSGLWVRRKKIF